jgi:hypothetical protein
MGKVYAITQVCLSNDQDTLKEWTDWTGVTDSGVTEPFVLGDRGTRREPIDVNYHIGGEYSYIWVKYEALDPTSTTPVLVDISPAHWPDWHPYCPCPGDGHPLDICPVGWKRSDGPGPDYNHQGRLNPGSHDECDRIGLCVRYLPLNEAATYVGCLSMTTKTNDDVETIYGSANDQNITLTRVGRDIHRNCGDSQYFFLYVGYCSRKPALAKA